MLLRSIPFAKPGVIGNLYNDLYKTYKTVKEMIQKNKININSVIVNNKNDIPKTDLLDSNFCVSGFKDELYKKTKNIIVYKNVLNYVNLF